MGNTTVLILAAGNAVRFNGIRKQLLQLNGDYTILSRIIAQCLYYGHAPIVVAKDIGIYESALEYGALVCKPAHYGVTCETLLSTYDLWNERTVVLLGDVIYSPKAFDTIMQYAGNFAAFGNSFETFAFSFGIEDADKLASALEIARQFGLGKLRYAYKAFVGLPMDCKEQEGTPPGKNWVWVNDWTRDIDMQVEYDDTVKQLVNTRRLEKLA